MQFLSKENLLQWKEKLPDDVLRCLDEITDEGQQAADELSASFASLQTTDDFFDFINSNQEKFIEIGRTRRLRFLAWCTARFYSDKIGREKLISAITEGGSDDGEGQAGRGKVAPYFLQDIKAFAEAIGPRAAGFIVDENTLSTIAGVGFEIASDLDMRGGR